jgi:hypothetical protein
VREARSRSLWGVHAICSLPLILFGTLAVSIRDDLQFGTGEQGVVAAGFVVAAAATTAWVGRFVDGPGGPRWISIASAVAAVGLLGGAVISRSFVTLVPWMAVAGIALGIAQPASDAFLHGAVPRDRQGLAFSLKQAFAGPGMGLLAGLAVPAAAAIGGWRSAFVVGSIMAGVVAIAAASRTRSVVVVDELIASAPSGGRLPLRPLLALAAAGALAAAPQGAFLGFAVSSAIDSGVRQGTAGLLFSASCVPAIAVRLLLGRRVDRRAGISILGLVAALLLVSVVGFVCMSIGWASAVVVGVPFLAATAWGWPGLFFLVAVRTSPAAPGRAAGIAGCGVLVGAVAGPLLFGLGAEWSFGASWLFTGACSLAAAGSMLLTRQAIVAALAATKCGAGEGGLRLSRPS